MKVVRGLEALGVISVLALLAPACGDDPNPSGTTAGSGGKGGSSAGSGSGGKAGGGGGKAGSGSGGKAGSGSGGNAGSSTGAGQGGEGGEPSSGTGGSSASGGSAGKGGRGGPGGTGGTGGTSGDAGSGGEGSDPPVDPARDPRCDDATLGELQGSGTPQDPYLLCLPDQLALLDTAPYTLDQSYELGDDLDLDDFTGSFTTFTTPFTGTLDGRSHALRNLPAALFTNIDNPGKVIALTVAGDVDATGQTTSWGLLTRYNSGAVLSCRASGTLAAGDHVGMLVGTNSGVVEDCSSSGTITNAGSHIGGLVGVNTGAVRRSFSTASVTGVNRVGGLVGRQSEPGLLEQSYALGPVTGAVGPGGLLGSLFGGEVRNCYARSAGVTGPDAGGLVGLSNGTPTILNSYATSQVSGTGSEGLVGQIEAGTLTVTSSYFLDTYSGTSGTALTDAELGQQASFVGWAFGSVWKMDAALSPYPSLAFETP